MFKKFICLIVALSMLLSFCGCSGEESGLYSLVQEISMLSAQEVSGSVDISAQGQLMDMMLAGMPNELGDLKKSLLEGIELKYKLKQVKNPLKYEVVLDARFKNEKFFRKLTTIIVANDIAYIKLNDLLTFIKPYILAFEPTESKTIDELISKVEYLQIDLKKMQSGSMYDIYNIYNVSADQADNNEKQIKAAFGIMNIFQNSFKDFSSGIVSKKKCGYELKLDVKEVQMLIIKLIDFVTANIDTVTDNAISSINNMSNEDLELLTGLYPVSEPNKEEIIQTLNEFRNKVKETSTLEIIGYKGAVLSNEGFKNLDGSSLTYYAGKTLRGTYELSTMFALNYMDQLKVNISENWVADKIVDFSINKPVNAVTEDTLKEIAKPYTQIKQMDINLLTGETNVVYGSGRKGNQYMWCENKNGSVYFPLQSFGEAFGETVGWDESKEIPYVTKDEKNIEMEGFITQGIPFIKVKDFEKIGYKVLWNEDTKVITIITP